MLTITPPADFKFDFRHPHEIASPPSRTATSPRINASKFRFGSLQDMATPHRGLPPPAAMTLPDPTRATQPPSRQQQNIDHMPAPPNQWHGAEDSMRVWLNAKSEEDRRRAEEQRTQQEDLRLQQRRIEQDMLRDSLHSSIPPHLIPVIFAGIGGGPIAQSALDIAQQHLAQLQQQTAPPQQPQQPQQQQQQQQQQQHLMHHASPELRHDQRMQAQPAYYTSQNPPPQTQQPATGQILPSHAQHANVYPSPAYQSPKGRTKTLYAAPTQYVQAPSTARPPAQQALPRLTTNEPATSAPSTYAQQQQEQQAQSPNIFFHHWQPPTTTSSSKDSQKPSPNVPSHVSGQQSSSSPRKRKATGSHQPAPPPSTSSPSFLANPGNSSKTGRSGHGRHRSGESNRTSSSYDPVGREARAGQREGSRSGGSSSEHSHAEDSASRHLSPPQSNEQRLKEEHS